MFVGPNSITSPVEVQLNPIKHLLVQQCLCADQQRLYILSASRDSSLDGKFMGPTAAHFARQILEEPVHSMRRGVGFLCKAGCCIYFDTFLYREDQQLMYTAIKSSDGVMCLSRAACTMKAVK